MKNRKMDRSKQPTESTLLGPSTTELKTMKNVHGKEKVGESIGHEIIPNEDSEGQTSVAAAVDCVHKHRKEWQQLNLFDKLLMIEQMLDILKSSARHFILAALERRKYGSFSVSRDVDSLGRAAEATYMTHMSDGLLYWWLSELRATYYELATNRRFPPWYSEEIVGESETSELIKCQLHHSSLANKLLLAGVEMTIYAERTHASRKLRSVPEAMALYTERIGHDGQGPNHRLWQLFNDALCGRDRWGFRTAWLPDDLQLSSNRLQFEAGDYFRRAGGQLVAILGAGNFDCPTDLLTALFVENNVVVYKLSPLSKSLRPVLQTIFAPLINQGFLRIVVDAGSSVTKKELLSNPKVHRWFMTGAATTAEKLLFPSQSDDVAERCRTESCLSRLAVEKTCILELGNVTPYIIAPQTWSASEILLHARHLAFHITYNGGHVCCHPQIIITSASWKQRLDFIRAVTQELATFNAFPHFYPKSAEHFAQVQERLHAEIGDRFAAYNGAIFATGIPHDSFLLKEEMFCRVAGEVTLDNSEKNFLRAAVSFANEKLSGSLACTLIIKDYSGSEVDEIVRSLNYTSIAINCHVATSFCTPQGVWGGYVAPPSLLEGRFRLNSGIGTFGNIYGFARPAKFVLQMPFRSLPLSLQGIPRSCSELEWNNRALCRMYEVLRRKGRGRRGEVASLFKIGAALTFGI